MGYGGFSNRLYAAKLLHTSRKFLHSSHSPITTTTTMTTETTMKTMEMTATTTRKGTVAVAIVMKEQETTEKTKTMMATSEE